MKRKITALLLTLLLFVTSSLPAFASNGDGINSLLEKIQNIPSDERDSYIILMVPMLMVDSGITELQKAVTNYQPGGQNGLMGQYIGKLLKYTEKDVLLNCLETIKCTNLNARRNFLEALRNKSSMSISSKAKTSIEILLATTSEDLHALNSLLEDCGIVIPKAVESYQAWQIYIKRVK